MNLEKLCMHITDFGFALIEAGFALDAQTHVPDKRNGTSLMWVGSQDAPLMVKNPSTIDCYLSLIEMRNYSYLMNDGGAIQIGFKYRGRSVEGHRLLYHPCPFLVTKEEAGEFGRGPVEFINGRFMDNVKDNLLLRSPIRFDYAPDEATESHPASHLTLDGPGCRIPVRSPLQFGTFIEFVLCNFYLDAWRHRVVDRLRYLRHDDEECLSDQDRRRIHLSWELARSRRRPRQRAPAGSRRPRARSRHRPSA